MILCFSFERVTLIPIVDMSWFGLVALGGYEVKSSHSAPIAKNTMIVILRQVVSNQFILFSSQVVHLCHWNPLLKHMLQNVNHVIFNKKIWVDIIIFYHYTIPVVFPKNWIFKAFEIGRCIFYITVSRANGFDFRVYLWPRPINVFLEMNVFRSG